MDLAGESKRNIDVTNEQGGKVKGALNYLAGFSENKITDQDGSQHIVLSQRMGDSGVVTGASIHPWVVTVADGLATVGSGKVFDGLLSVTELLVTLSTQTVVAGDVVYLTYTYSTNALTVGVSSVADFEPFTPSTADPITASHTPVAVIVEGVDDPAVITIDQIARNNFALVMALLNGKFIKTLLPR
jgi:hypothetical protein